MEPLSTMREGGKQNLAMKAGIETRLRAVWKQRKELLDQEQAEENLAFLDFPALRCGKSKNAKNPHLN